MRQPPPPATSTVPLSDDEEDMDVKGCCSGQRCYELFLGAIIDLFMAFWLGGVLYTFLNGNLAALLFLMLGLCFKCCLLMTNVDDSVATFLTHIHESDAEHEETINQLDKLRRLPPQIELHADAKNKRGKHAKVVAEDIRYWRFDAWCEMSGKPSLALDDYRFAMLEVGLEVVACDTNTQLALDAAMSDLAGSLLSERGPVSNCRLVTIVEHGDWTVAGAPGATSQKMFASRSSDAAFPCWMRKDMYLLCCLFFLGTLYRLIFNCLVPHLSFCLQKRIQNYGMSAGPASQALWQEDDIPPLEGKIITLPARPS